MPIDKIERLATGKSSWFKSPFKHARRVYLNFLQFMFRPGNMMDLDYHHDPKIAGINIVEGGKINKEKVGPKPVIAVSSDAGRQTARSIASIAERTTDGMIRRKEMMAFTLIVNIVSNDSDQAEEIASYVGLRTFLYQDFLNAEGFFAIGHDLTYPAVSDAASVIEGDIDGYFVGRVILPCSVLLGGTIDLVNFNMWNKLYVRFRNAKDEEEAYTILIEK